jgi:Flp pilus assembly protein TadG
LAATERISFWDDESGATYLEFTVGMMTFFVILFGIIEFAFIFYQWNAATKAVQFGARLAAVSDPVSGGLRSITGVGGSVKPGDPMPAFDISCSGATASCTGTGAGTYSVDAMNAIVYGRLADASGTAKTACATVSVTNSLQNGMCDFFSSINPANVVIRYNNTGLGYAGRPGGPVPTITVSLTGLSYNFIFLNSLFGFIGAPVPSLETTVTGEDLNAAGS